MSEPVCDWCLKPDPQLVQVHEDGWKMCPVCMVPSVPTEDCDRCGKVVKFDPERGDIILYAPPSFYEDATSFRHGDCRGRFDCADCGEQIDVRTEEYEETYRLPHRTVTAITHRVCPAFTAWAESEKHSAA